MWKCKKQVEQEAQEAAVEKPYPGAKTGEGRDSGTGGVERANSTEELPIPPIFSNY